MYKHKRFVVKYNYDFNLIHQIINTSFNKIKILFLII